MHRSAARFFAPTTALLKDAVTDATHKGVDAAKSAAKEATDAAHRAAEAAKSVAKDAKATATKEVAGAKRKPTPPGSKFPMISKADFE